MYMARTFMVHTLLHWTERGADSLYLWLFAVKNLVWLYNWLPKKESGITPLGILNRIKSDYCDLLHCHLWGCPILVLESKLQNDPNLPKCNY